MLEYALLLLESLSLLARHTLDGPDRADRDQPDPQKGGYEYKHPKLRHCWPLALDANGRTEARFHGWLEPGNSSSRDSRGEGSTYDICVRSHCAFLLDRCAVVRPGLVRAAPCRAALS